MPETTKLWPLAVAVIIAGCGASWLALHAGYGAVAVSIMGATGYFAGGATHA